MATFTSKINGNDIYAKRAERTRSGVNLETFTEGTGASAKTTYGILPAGIATPTKAEDIANTLATQKYVLDQMEVADALIYKGTVNANGDLPDGSEDAKKYKTGWTYKVATAGTYAGKVCEIGDMIIANKDWTSGATQNADWDVIQTNIDGAVTGPASVTADANIALFSGTTGKAIKDSGVTINKSTDQDGFASDSDAKVPTSKAVNGAITSAVNALDVSDLVQDSAGSMKGKTLLTLSETGGKIAATFQDIGITGAQVTVAPATSGNFAGFDENGHVVDSGSKAGDFKTKQTAVSDPTVPTSGTTTSLAFIDSITQDANGVITPTKKNVRTATTSQTGVVQLTNTVSANDEANAITPKGVDDAIKALGAEITSSDGTNVQVTVTEVDGVITAVNVADNTASNTHGHGNITNDGKVSVSDTAQATKAVVTDASGFVTAEDLTVAAPTATGTNTSGIAYIDSVSQGSTGKISASKTYVPVAGPSAYGVVTYETVDL